MAAFSSQKKIIDNNDWIKVVEIKNQVLYHELRQTLDQGESEAIVLALEINSDFLIIDEAKGRKIARSYGIKIIGLLGILVLAKEEGLINKIKPYLEDLKNNIGFRVSENLFEEILNQAGEK